MNKIRRFFNKYGITNLMYYIIVGNVLVFLADAIAGAAWGFDLNSWLVLTPVELFKGQIWRLFTFIFVLPELSTDFMNLVLWNFFTLYFYHMIGSNLERYFGTGKFNMVYATGIICTWALCLIGYAINWFMPSFWIMTSMSSSMINLGLFLAFATVFPNVELMLFFIIPIKVKWLGIIEFVMLVLQMISALVYGDVLGVMTVVAVLANYFIWFGREWAAKGWFFGKNKVRSAQHKSKIVKIKAKDVVRNYRHKCCVCGKTDESDPNMQFRYCVKCSGLKEYCMDHINDHTHS